jgi:hypothetical protein
MGVIMAGNRARAKAGTAMASSVTLARVRAYPSEANHEAAGPLKQVVLSI